MQTFLPYPDFEASAQCLDRQRLGKQRIEAMQILTAINNPSYGWQNHPAVNMWRDDKFALAQYGVAICLEWIGRGYRDNQLEYFEDTLWSAGVFKTLPIPAWIDDTLCLSHRSNLIRKMPQYYRKLWPDVVDNLEYVWPAKVTQK